MFTSCCPGWVSYAEKHCPDILPYVSTTRSPQGVSSALVKSYLSEKMGIPARRIRNISVMPCTAETASIWQSWNPSPSTIPT